MPDERSANAPRRSTTFRRPLRCPITMASIADVITTAPTVAMIVSPVAAPPAGADLAARVISASSCTGSASS